MGERCGAYAGDDRAAVRLMREADTHGASGRAEVNISRGSGRVRGSGRGSRGSQAKSYADLVRERRAQGTVEYAITMVAVLSLVLGCAAIWRAGESGVFTRVASEAASHRLDADGAVDVALY